MIEDVRAGFGHGDPTQRVSDSAGLIDALTILNRFRSSQCRDLRDKVYAFLSLWPQKFQRDAKCEILHVDYSLPVELATIYTDAAWAIMEASHNLRILSHVVVDASRWESGLPSWVPRWDTGQNIKV
jgi:hypothetical protein